jgi:hypothetical protein
MTQAARCARGEMPVRGGRAPGSVMSDERRCCASTVSSFAPAALGGLHARCPPRERLRPPSAGRSVSPASPRAPERCAPGALQARAWQHAPRPQRQATATSGGCVRCVRPPRSPARRAREPSRVHPDAATPSEETRADRAIRHATQRAAGSAWPRRAGLTIVTRPAGERGRGGAVAWSAPKSGGGPLGTRSRAGDPARPRRPGPSHSEGVLLDAEMAGLSSPRDPVAPWTRASRAAQNSKPPSTPRAVAAPRGSAFRLPKLRPAGHRRSGRSRSPQQREVALWRSTPPLVPSSPGAQRRRTDRGDAATGPDPVLA